MLRLRIRTHAQYFIQKPTGKRHFEQQSAMDFRNPVFSQHDLAMTSMLEMRDNEWTLMYYMIESIQLKRETLSKIKFIKSSCHYHKLSIGLEHNHY